MMRPSWRRRAPLLRSLRRRPPGGRGKSVGTGEGQQRGSSARQASSQGSGVCVGAQGHAPVARAALASEARAAQWELGVGERLLSTRVLAVCRAGCWGAGGLCGHTLRPLSLFLRAAFLGPRWASLRPSRAPSHPAYLELSRAGMSARLPRVQATPAAVYPRCAVPGGRHTHTAHIPSAPNHPRLVQTITRCVRVPGWWLCACVLGVGCPLQAARRGPTGRNQPTAAYS